jgi:CHAT domain-containing protein/Tfp pilus assembly protein PilF
MFKNSSFYDSSMRAVRETVVLIVHLLFAAALSVQTNATGSFPLLERPISGSQNTREIAVLQLGNTIERELAGGQKDAYRLDLLQSQYAAVKIEQRGVDVVAHLLAADGRLFADVDSQRTTQGTEKVELFAEVAGSYKIEIEPSSQKAGIGSYSIQLSVVRDGTADEKLLHEARNQYYESQRLSVAAKTDKALELAKRALETREKLLPSDHEDVAASLRAVGTLYSLKNDLVQMEAFFRRAGEATAKAFGTETLEYAEVLRGLARIPFSKADFAKSEELIKQALSIQEKAAGPDSLPVASSLFNLGMIYRASNDLPRTEQMYLRALAIREQLLGPNHTEVSSVLNNLGLLYYGAGDYTSAEPIFQRGLKINENVFGPEHEQVGRILNNLGLLELKRKSYDKAEAYYRRALSIFEKSSGPESDGVASLLHNLGVIYKETGKDLGKAEEYYRRALAIWERIFGKESSTTAIAVGSLGILYRDLGDYDRAEQFHLRALAINDKTLGPNSTETVRSLLSVSRLYAIKGDLPRSIEYQRRISEIEEKMIPLNLTLGSERQKIAYFSQLPNQDRVITLHVRLAGDNGDARDLAITSVLRRKGRVLDALSENLSALRRRFNTEDQSLLDGLSDINSQLARLVLAGPLRKSLQQHHDQIKGLEEKREKIEAEISRRSAGAYEDSRPIKLEAIQSAIPSDAALLEFVTYKPFQWKTTDEKSGSGEPHYVVYVIRNKGEVRWAELGAAKDVDSAVRSWRQALRDPRRKDVEQLSREVDQKVMQPLRALIGDATHLLVSPDGILNLIPFEALVDNQGRYLVEHYAITYLTSGRELQRMQVTRNSLSNPIVMADPLFGDPETDQPSKYQARRQNSISRRQSVNTGGDLSEVYFGPLGGTEREASTIKSLFPEITLLTGAAATEARLKQAAAPRLLHIATHGFFLTDETNDTVTRGTRAISTTAKIENPLLRSGLALAGANLHKSSNDDGILTALEASGLNLWGTKLVTLSACDTGLGEVRNGEGVYGLRRSFVLAGAETLVMSLWPVSDYVTREMMTAYYKGLKQGLGRGESLRQVQLSMLKRKGREHPFYWASFIQSGEWANLDGRR